jgi:dolichol-phosphate mannosyltransferase
VNPDLRGIFLSRNFGHQSALSIGLTYCDTDIVGILDCDLQDPVDVLLKLLDKVESGAAEVAFGIRNKRQAPGNLKFLYMVFYLFMARTSEHPWPRDAGDFCVMSRRVVEEINRLPERVRIIRGLRSWVGFRQIGVPYDRPKRAAGHTHYSYARLFRLALDAVVGFSILPLRLSSLFGLFFGLMSLLAGIFLLINRFFSGFEPFGYKIGVNPGLATIAILGTFLGSVILICLGVIGEYLGVLLKEMKGRPSAIVVDTVGWKIRLESKDISSNRRCIS